MQGLFPMSKLICQHQNLLVQVSQGVFGHLCFASSLVLSRQSVEQPLAEHVSRRQPEKKLSDCEIDLWVVAAFWRSRFNADPGIVGNDLKLEPQLATQRLEHDRFRRGLRNGRQVRATSEPTALRLLSS